MARFAKIDGKNIFFCYIFKIYLSPKNSRHFDKKTRSIVDTAQVKTKENSKDLVKMTVGCTLIFLYEFIIEF